MTKLECKSFPSQEKIKHMCSSQNSIVILTDSNRIFRWNLQDEEAEFKEFTIPERTSEKIKSNIKNFGNILLDGTKNLFG